LSFVTDSDYLEILIAFVTEILTIPRCINNLSE